VITIRMQVTKRCPYVDETDTGILVITMPGDAPELHGLAGKITAVGDGRISHEEFTRRVLALLPRPALVVTHWQTGPWHDVECREGDEWVTA
jgi:hypothetical protein